MKTFEKYLDKMGYGWNDFDRPSEMKNLIEQYADEKVKQALTIPAVSASTVIKELHEALKNLLQATDDEGWHCDGKDWEEQEQARRALANVPKKYLR